MVIHQYSRRQALVLALAQARMGNTSFAAIVLRELGVSLPSCIKLLRRQR